MAIPGVPRSEIPRPDRGQSNPFGLGYWTPFCSQSFAPAQFVLQNENHSIPNELVLHDEWYIDNIIHLPRELLRCYPDHRSIERGLGAMVTYYDLFTFVIMLCSVITLVIMILNNRK